jgi:serine/threonine protein kinase
MTEAIKSPVYEREFLIVSKSAQGGQGSIWKTDEPSVLVKQCEPELVTDDPGRQETLRQKASVRYKVFCAVNKSREPELYSLPREYVTFRGNPAYLMQRAEGVLLQSLMRKQRSEASQHLPLALALARALGKLHHAQIVHADVHPENYIVCEGPTGFTVIVLDIDGGGLLSPPGPLYPTTQPKRLYKAPELSRMKWQQLYERHLFFAPDDWALAVLLYQILVDYEGPFCTVKSHPNPSVTNYTPYPSAAYRERSVSWPAPWQEALLAQSNLSHEVVSLFYATFARRFLFDEKKRKVISVRPTASDWEKALAPQPALSPLRPVYRLQTVSAPLPCAPAPAPLPVHEAVLRRRGGTHVIEEPVPHPAEQRPAPPGPQTSFAPETSPLLPDGHLGPKCKSAAGTVLPEGRGEDAVRVCVHDAPPLPRRWRKAMTVIVRILHLRKGVSGNGRRLTHAA